MIIKGTAHWAKIVGEPGWGYKKQHKEWSMDVSIDETTRKQLISEGMDGSYIKNKGDDRGDFITFRRRSVKANGDPAKPIDITDAKGETWGKDLIGNGSTVLVKIALNDREGAKTKKPSLIKVRIMNLVAYEGGSGDSEDFEDYVDANGEEKWD